MKSSYVCQSEKTFYTNFSQNLGIYNLWHTLSNLNFQHLQKITTALCAYWASHELMMMWWWWWWWWSDAEHFCLISEYLHTKSSLLTTRQYSQTVCRNNIIAANMTPVFSSISSSVPSSRLCFDILFSLWCSSDMLAQWSLLLLQ